MDTPLEIVLIRHGRTSWNATHRFLGQTDIPLDPVGRVQARRLSVDPQVARAGRVVASPLRRALDTARLLGRPVEVVHGLEELHQGALEGLRVDEALARYPSFFRAWAADPHGVPVPGGESLDQARDRGIAALERVAAEKAGGGVVAVVSHQLVIASVCCTLADRPLREWRRFGLANTGYRRLRFDGRRWALVG